MALLIVLFIISIPLTIFLMKLFIDFCHGVERKIGSRNFFLLSLAWWLWDDWKRK